MRSTNPREVAYMFREFTRRIHAKAVPTDPNFLRISVACGKVNFFPTPTLTAFSPFPYPQIEQWCEHHYPSFVRIQAGGAGAPPQQFLSPDDARTRIFHLEQTRERELSRKKRVEELRSGPVREERQPTQEGAGMEMIMYVVVAFVVVLSLCVGAIWVILMIVGEETAEL